MSRILRYGGAILCTHACTRTNTLYQMWLSIGNQCNFFIASVIWSYFPRFVIILAVAFNSLWSRLMIRCHINLILYIYTSQGLVWRALLTRQNTPTQTLYNQEFCYQLVVLIRTFTILHRTHYTIQINLCTYTIYVIYKLCVNLLPHITSLVHIWTENSLSYVCCYWNLSIINSLYYRAQI